METATMGKVIVTAKVENLNDSVQAGAGLLRPDEVRTVEVADAVVDTGAKLLSLPKRLIERLGLERFETRFYRAVWLTIGGRRCTVDVAEVHDDCPVLIGYVPLELLDFVVDPVQRTLIGDPRHHGQNILDLF